MPMRFSAAVRNPMLDTIETTIGASPVLEMRTGAQPATPETAATGTVVATLPLPADWMANAATGSKALLGLWQDTAADASGTAGYFRIRQGATGHIDGTITASGGGGDLTLDNPNLAIGQQVTVTAFTVNIPA